MEPEINELDVGSFIKVVTNTGLGTREVTTTRYGILISYVPVAPNMYDNVCNIRVLVTTGELKELSLFHGDSLAMA